MISLTKGYVTMSDIQSTQMNARWTRSKVIMVYDSNPNITLAWLSRASGWTVAELKKVLLEWDNYTQSNASSAKKPKN